MKKSYIFLFIIPFLTNLTHATIAGDKSMDSVNRKFHLLSLSAIQGNAADQYKLGVLYLDGKGAAKNSKEAIKWLQSSAYRTGREHAGGIFAINHISPPTRLLRRFFRGVFIKKHTAFPRFLQKIETASSGFAR